MSSGRTGRAGRTWWHALLGYRRAGREVTARRRDRGRGLRRDHVAAHARPGRGHAHDRRRRQRAADRCTEITLARLLFRSGQSEYSLDGGRPAARYPRAALRLGLGRAIHVIVGQGHSTRCCTRARRPARADRGRPGVLGVGERKEKALRKLDTMQADLTGLVDLTTELGRRSSRSAARRGWPGRPRPSKRICVTPGCDCSPMTTSRWPPSSSGQRRVRRWSRPGARAGHRAVPRAGQGGRARGRGPGARRQARPRAGDIVRAVRPGRAVPGSEAGLAAERHRHLSADPDPVGSGRDPDALDAEAATLRGKKPASPGGSTSAGRLDTAVQSRTAAGPRWPSERRLAGRRATQRPAPSAWPSSVARSKRRAAAGWRRRRRWQRAGGRAGAGRPACHPRRAGACSGRGRDGRTRGRPRRFRRRVRPGRGRGQPRERAGDRAPRG